MEKYTEIIQEYQVRRSLNIDLYENESLSLPVLRRGREERLEDVLFTYFYSLTSADVSEPYADIRIDAESGTIVFYAIREEDDLSMEESEEYELVEGDQNDYEDPKERVMELYEEIREFAFEDILTEDEFACLKEYKELFWKVIRKDHAWYYKKIGEDFWKWIDDSLESEKDYLDENGERKSPFDMGWGSLKFENPFKIDENE